MAGCGQIKMGPVSYTHLALLYDPAGSIVRPAELHSAGCIVQKACGLFYLYFQEGAHTLLGSVPADELMKEETA